VGAFSALVGSIIGAGGSYLVASHAADASAHQAELAVRRDVYAKYYGDMAEYVAVLGNGAARVQEALQASPTDEVAPKALLEQLEPHVNTMFRDQAQVVLAGPEEVENAAFHLNLTVNQAQNALTSSSLAPEDVDPILKDIGDDLNAFADAASKDLDDDAG
jgi:hypothetical protein